MPRAWPFGARLFYRGELIFNSSEHVLSRRQSWLDLLDKLLILLLLVSAMLFVLWPFVAIFYEGVREQSPGQLWAFIRSSKGLIRNSLTVAALTTLLTILWALAISITLFFAGPRLSKLIRALLTLSMISPPFVAALSFINLFGRRGLITYRLLGLRYNPYGLQGIVLMETFSFISLAAMILMACLRDIDQSLIDSARSLGANTNQIIRDVLLPQLRSATLVALMLTFIRSLADFSTPTIIGGSYSVLATEAYLSFISRGDLQRATGLNLILLLPSLLAMIVYMRAYRQASSASHGVGRRQIDNRGKGAFLRLAQVLAMVFLLAMVLQYGSIFLQAFGKYSKGQFYLTLDNLYASKNHIGSSLWRSVGYSLLSAALAGFMGFLLAYYLHLRKMRFMQGVEWILTLPYIVPGSFYGIAYILAFRAPPLKLTGTATIVILNMLFKQIPLATKLASAGVAGIEPSLGDSVRDLGGHPLYIFKDVLFPQCLPTFLLCFFRGFTAGMTTIGSIIFLVYPQRKLATMVLFDLIQSGKYGVASFLAFIITLICLLVELAARKLSGVEAD